ncbi:MAG: hypothetical protein AB7O74_09065 [Candidatus Nanopelagicales bacterium]
MGESSSSVLTEPAPVAPEPPTWSRGRRAVAALVVLAVAAGAVWFWAGSSDVSSGSMIGPGSGMQELSDGIEQTKWLQTSEDGAIYFTVRNDGRFPMVLGVPPGEDESYWVGPHRRIGLAPVDLRTGGIPGWPAVPELSSALTLQPGDEAYVVYRVLYPSRCLQVDALAHNPTYYYAENVTLSTSTLGRTTETVVPLPYPVYTPTIVNIGCTPEDFAVLDARYPVQQ